MYIANSHLKIMQSFVAAPQIHVAALKNPAMRGGPFINCDVSKVPVIKALMECTLSEQAHMLEFAAAVRDFSKTMRTVGTGCSLEPLYQQLPEVLKGYVELVYDLNHSPSIRFIEALLYKSRYYDASRQSLALSLVEGDDRPFALSTPHLAGPDCLTVNLPFGAETWDRLFEMKRNSRPLGYIAEALGVKNGSVDLLSTFFTEEAPRPAEKYMGDSVRVRYFGHACLLIESKESCILTDPVVSYNHGDGILRYTYDDLPENIDYALITHNHQDHCLFETLLQLRHKIRTIVVPKNNGGGLADPSLKLVLQNIGFDQIREIDEIETIKIDGGEITGLPFLGEHADLNIRTKIAYLVNLKDRLIICAADSNNIEPKLYEHLHDLIGDIDLLFLGMECDGGPLSWLYGPVFTEALTRKQDQSRRLDGSDFAKGIDMVDRLKPKQVYVYAMGQEPWLTYLTSIQYTDESRPIIESDKLVEECRRRGIESERLYGKKLITL